MKDWSKIPKVDKILGLNPNRWREKGRILSAMNSVYFPTLLAICLPLQVTPKTLFVVICTHRERA